MSISKVNNAYVAGMIDADGTIYVPGPGVKCNPHLILYQSIHRSDLLLSVMNHFNCGSINIHKTTKDSFNKEPMLRYRVNKSADIKRILKKLLPHLVLKKDKAQAVLQLV